MFRSDSITARIHEYERSQTDHRAGTLDAQVVRAMEDLAPRTLKWSMETGCGKSTILLSNLSERHVVFAYDDTTEERSSIRYYSECPVFRADRTTLVPGATQVTLPTYAFEQPIDFALLDGPHGYPFPELEYYYVYPYLRPGALLVVDDIHIPTIHRLYTFLSEDVMFDLVRVERTTAFFRRTDAPVFSPYGDGWEFQEYNRRRFPVDVMAASPASPAGLPDAALAEALDELARTRRALDESREETAQWQHVADARRLKRRLARHLGDWRFLK